MLEDIVDRLTDDLNRFREHVDEDRKRDGAVLRSQARALLGACETALQEMRDHLELASDPHFDLAYEVTMLDREKEKLEKELSSLGLQRQKLGDEIQGLQQDRKKLKLELRHQERQRALAERDYEKLASQNFDAAVDVHISQELLREHKPDD